MNTPPAPLRRRDCIAAMLAMPVWAHAQPAQRQDTLAPAAPSASASGSVSATEAAPARAATQDGAWRDAVRQREIPWRVRWPAGQTPCALVLYSHGLGGSRDGGDAWGEAWRAAGIAVLHLQHAGSDAEALRGGLPTLRSAASAQQFNERVRDIRFGIDELARRAAGGEDPWARVCADAIGVAGHSFGAHTTQALAGQRYGAAAGAGFADARPRAFIAFSPSPARGGAMTPSQAFGAVARPFFSVTGSLDADPFPGQEPGRTSGDFRALVHQGLPRGERALLWLDGADHMTFAGNAQQRIRSGIFFKRERVAEDLEARHHALVAALTARWWCARLLGDAQALRALAAPDGLGPRDRFEMG